MGIKGSALSSWPGRGWALKGVDLECRVEGKNPQSPCQVFERASGIAMYDSFQVLKESLTRSRLQLGAIGLLTAIQRQFVGTLVDTEAAIGYFLRPAKPAKRPAWIAYMAVKMKYRGDLARLAGLIGHQPPSESLNKNALTQTRPEMERAGSRSGCIHAFARGQTIPL